MMCTRASDFFKFIKRKHNNMIYNYVDDVIRLEGAPLAMDVITYLVELLDQLGFSHQQVKACQSNYQM